MKIKYLNLVFENLESVNIDGKYIVDFNCNDIKTSVSRIAVNSIEEMVTCKNFYFSVKKEGNKEFENLVNEVQGDIFSRICYNDITSISFKLVDERTNEKKVYQMYVTYKDGLHDTNELQESFISKGGNLFVSVGESKTFINRVKEDVSYYDKLIKRFS